MKYIEKIPPTEIQHTIQVSDTELKFLLELAHTFATRNVCMVYDKGQTHETSYRPNDNGFDILAGAVQMTGIVDIKSFDADKYWTELDT